MKYCLVADDGEAQVVVGESDVLEYIIDYADYCSISTYKISVPCKFHVCRREPPVKKFRPWTPEEVPVGAVLRNKCVDAYRALIIGVNDDGRLVYSLNQADQSVMGDDLESALKYRLVSLDPVGTPDNERTWLPCGLEVDA